MSHGNADSDSLRVDGLPDRGNAGDPDHSVGQGIATSSPKEVVRFNLRLSVEVDPQGQVTSFHDFEDPKDWVAALSLPGGGVRHIAHALLTEAVRREAFTILLLGLTKNPEYIREWDEAEAETKSALEKEMAHYVTASMGPIVAKLAPGAVTHVLQMVQSQMRLPKG